MKELFDSRLSELKKKTEAKEMALTEMFNKRNKELEGRPCSREKALTEKYNVSFDGARPKQFDAALEEERRKLDAQAAEKQKSAR